MGNYMGRFDRAPNENPLMADTYDPSMIDAASTNSCEKTATFVAVFSFEAPVSAVST
jgi:hypothetical protein